jgi:16S rRNA C1402 N4-methylase RsmH
MDEPTAVPKVPTASDVLQHVDERDLIRILKAYGGLKTKARFVAEAILEARYMFHHFKTTQASHFLYEIIWGECSYSGYF